ncbi:hypothetical protein EJV46_05840 [Roseococcus sp. SYP-B2431]|uniref:hypothetical protein n=1 Tax=Roseococcus sp. SYP-B2431 TaxID=2496640 RepID=UPI00103E278C|nr:hypothetical protein [Roseococcus sp. SYP-B2431]TCI00172.1 hypothetical protein EJV46_05840 [Roseococcus sp. SYP-B2431]
MAIEEAKNPCIAVELRALRVTAARNHPGSMDAPLTRAFAEALWRELATGRVATAFAKSKAEFLPSGLTCGGQYVLSLFRPGTLDIVQGIARSPRTVARESAPRPAPSPPYQTPPAALPVAPVGASPMPPSLPGQSARGDTMPSDRLPQERSQSVLGTLERLRKAQAEQQAPAARSGSSPQSSAPIGVMNLTAAERARIADRIGECWAMDAGAPNIQSIVVELRVQPDAGGVVRQVLPNDSVPDDPRARMVYEAARRALLDPRCSPLPLPRERLEALRSTVFRFNPRELGLR